MSEAVSGVLQKAPKGGGYLRAAEYSFQPTPDDVWVPAKLIRERFTKEIGKGMDRLAWWDWDHMKLRKALDDFRALSAEDFLARYAL